ncbi:MAG: desulfoferrodoxin [Firmicutes bacterium]|nr:desulfoferrodoxin [Bacillota bacterium]
MKENTRFYVCPVCGKVIGLLSDTDIPTVCCGQEMQLLEANTTDAALEKHVPVYTVDEGEGEIVVSVGSIDHPMEKDHYIMWIAVVTDKETTRVQLFPEQAPTARMKYIPGAMLYAYCNKHGLWKTKVD